MSSITNGDDFQRGWNEGHKAALDGNGRDYSRMGMSWKFVFHGNTALDSYTEGYKKGYEAGINEKNVVRKVELINNNGMDYNSANAQNFERELMALENLNRFLVDFCNRIAEVNGEFLGYMNVIADTGVPAEACKKFDNEFYVKDDANFKAIYERIAQNDLPRIKMYIEQICRHIGAATGNIPSVNFIMPDFSISPTTPRGANTGRNGSSQDLEVQLDAICDIMDFFVNLRNELMENILRQYERCCNDMINSGVPKQIVEDYGVNCVGYNVDLVKKTASQIQNADYPQMKKLFNEISNSLGQLQRSFNRNPLTM